MAKRIEDLQDRLNRYIRNCNALLSTRAFGWNLARWTRCDIWIYCRTALFSKPHFLAGGFTKVELEMWADFMGSERCFSVVRT